MKYFVHKIEKDKQYFLQEGRKDPLTGAKIKIGDEVVICASCKSAFLKDSWEYMRSEHCGQSNTLKVLPRNRDMNINTTSRQEINKPIPAPTPSPQINWTWVIIFILASIVAIVFFITRNTKQPTISQSEEITEEEKLKLKSIAEDIIEESEKKNSNYMPNPLRLKSFYTDEIQTVLIKENGEKSHKIHTSNEYVNMSLKYLSNTQWDKHTILSNSWEFEKDEFDDTYQVSFIYEYQASGNGITSYTKSKRTYKMNKNFKIFYYMEEVY